MLKSPKQLQNCL